MFLSLLLVGIGGFFGAVARFAITSALNKRFYRIPLGTLMVNLPGAFLLGILIGLKMNEKLYLLVGTGFFGGFTTFSTLKLEMLKLYLNDDKKGFLLYTFITYGGGIAFAYAGYIIGQWLA